MSDTDPRIVHVASELSVDLSPGAENEGCLEYILDVIAAVDYANEQCDLPNKEELRKKILSEAVQRVEALWQDECCGYKNPRICASCRAYEYVIAAIKGEQA